MTANIPRRTVLRRAVGIAAGAAIGSQPVLAEASAVEIVDQCGLLPEQLVAVIGR
ncbi:hypothetical protein ACFU7Y_25015 [Kitasatospora sp. NPDC057542]|uniref:hypothetical protein n=1 Tax=Kitasatospora sp. NPDC057542 TaxID=3346162 RepID=UPI0036764AD8